MSYIKKLKETESWKMNKTSTNCEDDKNFSFQNTTLKPTILSKPQSTKSETTSKSDGSSTWQEVSSSPGTPIAPKFSLCINPQNNSADKKNLAKGSLETKLKNLSFTNSESQVVHNNVTKSVAKMIDSTNHWVENGIDMLQDQNEFLVVGVLGAQGVGKSTIMSILAGCKFDDNPKNTVFRKQTNELKERAAHMTTGVEFTVTSERVILLDTQPILSASVLEQLIQDRKNSDYSANPSIQTQSLQLATFILTVCHVVIVVQDYFTDLNIYNFLNKAKMMKPPAPSVPHDSSANIERNPTEIQPVLIYIHNKLEPNFFSNREICRMNTVIKSCTKFSTTFCNNHFSLSKSGLYPGLSKMLIEDEVNHFIFPNIADTEESDYKKVTYDESDTFFLELQPFSNVPNLDLLTQTFVEMLLSTRRHSITQQSLTEKNWFHYAARTWEAIKKPSTVLEFSRLFSS